MLYICVYCIYIYSALYLYIHVILFFQICLPVLWSLYQARRSKCFQLDSVETIPTLNTIKRIIMKSIRSWTYDMFKIMKSGPFKSKFHKWNIWYILFYWFYISDLPYVYIWWVSFHGMKRYASNVKIVISYISSNCFPLKNRRRISSNSWKYLKIY